jgi:hypothetical protein
MSFPVGNDKHLWPAGRNIGQAKSFEDKTSRPKEMIMPHALAILTTVVVLSAALRADEPQVVFEDRFQGKLAEGWTWLREDPQAWRLKDGGLEIRVQAGKAATVKNALVRAIPDRSQGMLLFEVTVSNLSKPIQQYEQAGLTWYHNGRPIFKLVKELVDGKVMIVPGKIAIADEPVTLRITVEGKRYTAQYRLRGETQWRTAFTGKLSAAGKGKDEISLQCYDGPPNAQHWMRFTDFRILR